MPSSTTIGRPLAAFRTLGHRVLAALVATSLGLAGCGGAVEPSGATAAATATAATVTATDATAAAWVPVEAAVSSAGPLALSATAATAGVAAPLTAEHLVLVVAEGDALSEGAARAYQRARGIPDRQVLRVRLPAGVGDVIDATRFEALRTDLMARLDEQAQVLLVTWSQPSRVQGTCTMSLTAALTFGYDPARCGGCNVTTPSPYFDSSSARPWSDLQLRPSMMLGASTLATAETLIARGLAAEGLITRGAQAQAWLVRTNDAARSVRYPDFALAALLPVEGLTWHRIDNASGGNDGNLIVGQSGLLFYFTGLTQVGQIATHQWLPGAVADHMTSFGGVLPSGYGQMPATAWLEAGATGTYGTVEEPCNYVQKFPQVSVLARHYAAGQTLIEALWKSVRWPGQGLFLGDPLARPWAAR